MFIGMDPPKHDRLKALFQRGLHAEADRRARGRDPRDRRRACSTGSTAARRCDLVTDVAQPVVSRVIGSFMGIPPEDDAIWARLMNSTLGAGDPDLNPEGIEGVIEQDIPEIFERCRQLIAERRENPTDDLTSVLVHAEIDGEKLEEHEIVMGFFLLVAAGNDSTKATYCSGMRALMENPDQRADAARRPVADPERGRGVAADVPGLRPLPPHGDRATPSSNGQPIREGEKVVMWYVSSNRDETRYEDPDRFDVRRNPEHQAFGAGGRHFCLGTALARLELRILFEETLARFPAMELAGRPDGRRVALPQPAEDAAGPLVGGRPPLPPGSRVSSGLTIALGMPQTESGKPRPARGRQPRGRDRRRAPPLPAGPPGRRPGDRRRARRWAGRRSTAGSARGRS